MARLFGAGVVLLAALSGCACPSVIDLESEWRPLLRIKTDASVPVGTYRTNGDTCYTGSTCDFLAHDAVQQTGLKLHESLHSARQFAYPGGPATYLARYNSDINFMIDEEIMAWNVEISYDVQHGEAIDVNAIAQFMSTTYVQGPSGRNPGLPGIGYNEAQVWARNVIAKAQGH